MILITDEKQVRNLVLWLEDQKIRQYKVEDRAELRDIDSLNWPITFKQYCHDVACPIEGKLPEQLEWLLGFAVRLEYADNRKYKDNGAKFLSCAVSNFFNHEFPYSFWLMIRRKGRLAK